MRRMVALAARQELGKQTKASILEMTSKAGLFVSPQKTAKADALLCGAHFTCFTGTKSTNTDATRAAERLTKPQIIGLVVDKALAENPSFLEGVLNMDAEKEAGPPPCQARKKGRQS